MVSLQMVCLILCCKTAQKHQETGQRKHTRQGRVSGNQHRCYIATTTVACFQLHGTNPAKFVAGRINSKKESGCLVEWRLVMKHTHHTHTHTLSLSLGIPPQEECDNKCVQKLIRLFYRVLSCLVSFCAALACGRMPRGCLAVRFSCIGCLRLCCRFLMVVLSYSLV